MATKKKAAKKKAAAPAKQKTPTVNEKALILAIVDGPNTPRSAMDELQNFLQGKNSPLCKKVKAAMDQGHTASESVELIKQALK